jgi:hypothetical protein
MAKASLTLFREKTSIVTHGAEPEREVAVLRSCRLTLPLGNSSVRQTITVRGQNVADTLRMAAQVFAEARQGPTLINRTPPIDWQQHWDGISYGHRVESNRATWIKLYGEGRLFFTTRPCPYTNLIERHAVGNSLNEDSLRAAALDIGFFEGHEVRIRHASKASVAITRDDGEYRCSIQVRDRGEESVFSFSVPETERGVHFGSLFELAAHYVESHEMVVFIDKVRDQYVAKRIPNSATIAREVESAIARRRATNRLIVDFEQTSGVRYRPERPMFLAS